MNDDRKKNSEYVDYMKGYNASFPLNALVGSKIPASKLNEFGCDIVIIK